MLLQGGVILFSWFGEVVVETGLCFFEKEFKIGLVQRWQGSASIIGKGKCDENTLKLKLI